MIVSILAYSSLSSFPFFIEESDGSSEHHQNNNLKVVIAFGNFIGKDNSFFEINKKEQVLEFLNTKVKRYDEDPG